MNLAKFLKYVDDAVSEMTGEQITAFVHEIARTLPERQRNHFIETLKSVKKNRNAAGDKPDSSMDALELLRRDIAQVTKFLNAVNEGDLRLDSEIDYQYNNGWGWDEDYKFLFSDPEDIQPIINEAIELLHRCIDLEAYPEGAELAGILFRLTVEVEGDYEDYDGTPLQIDDLFNEDLLDGTYDDFVHEALYLIYTGNSLPERPAFLYNCISGLQYVDTKLEDIMQLGDQDLPDFDIFLPLWIAYLGKQNGSKANNLLDEALSMAGEDQYLEAARKFSDIHPELYKQILQNGMSDQDDAAMMKIGLEALEKIQELSILRGEIALLTADYAKRINDQRTAEFCWIEAFRSDVSPENYLRLRFFLPDYEKHAGQIRRTYEDFRNKTNCDGFYGSDLRNKICCLILFFEKRFDETMKMGLNVEEPLGWTYTFMKEGIALFLLLLFNGDKLPRGLQSMRSIALEKLGFNMEKFLSGTAITPGNAPEAKFWDSFDEWKSGVDFSGEEYDKWMDTIGHQIEKRIDGIMQANRRNYYSECAAFIAAYGEVLESQGVPHGKTGTMESYRAKYPRRSSFISALRSYGM